jgi:hypothetical protein
MTTLAKLITRKQQLLERLQERPGPHERDEIERLLTEIDEALMLLDEGGPGISGDQMNRVIPSLPGPLTNYAGGVAHRCHGLADAISHTNRRALPPRA